MTDFPQFTVTLDLEVYDPEALFTAAMVRAAQNGIPVEEARRILFDEEEGEPNQAACLLTLLDPGEERLPGAVCTGAEVVA